MAKRTSKMITKKEDIEFLLNLTREDITSSAFMEMFGEFDGPPRFEPFDLIVVPKGRYGRDVNPNQNDFTTTVGKLILNKIFIEARDNILKHIGWWDDVVTKKAYGKMFDRLGYLRLEGDITIEDYKYFCNNTQIIMPYVSILANSFTDTMLTCSKQIDKKKAKLVAENKAALEAGDLKTVEAIQDELLDYARDILRDDPSMDMYNSGSLGDFENNFKNMFVMKGASKDPDPAKPYFVITSNYIDGVSAEDYSKLSNTLAEGPYSRSKKTENGGWWEKLFVAAFQHITLLDEGSDCGTKRYVEMDVTEKNIDSIMYCYVIEGNKLVEITSRNRDKFIGKKVKIRYSSLCEAKNGICSKCAGNLWYRLGFKNVGVICPQIPSRVKLIMMKSFHDSQINLVEMDPMKAFSINE